MNKIILIIVMFFLVACGSRPEKTSFGVDSDLQPYVDELNQLSLQYVGKEFPLQNVSINFKKLPLTMQGICYFATQEIFINTEFWDVDDTSPRHNQRLALILHEIAHCAFFKDHDTEHFDPSKGRPETILSEGAVSEHYFKSYTEHYVRSAWIGVE